jgi:alpha-galactosidase
VDPIKIDRIASRPYKGDEVRVFHEAIVKSGRPMLLSLSPGEAPPDEAGNLEAYAQQWRISDDEWDVWHSAKAYPQGLNDQFSRAARWIAAQSSNAGGGHWRDADMLAVGRLGPAPGYGKPRDTRRTHDERRTRRERRMSGSWRSSTVWTRRRRSTRSGMGWVWMP